LERRTINPRPDWRERVESQGMHFHTSGPETYWDESAYYLFNGRDIEEIEKAAYSLNQMCLDAVQYVIDHDRFADFRIPPRFVDYIKQSWERDELTIYGRFDLSYDGHRAPALLEYNADTPTSLLEASVIQWHWYKDVAEELGPGTFDQFNSLHEKLIEAWKKAAVGIDLAGPGNLVHFASVGLEASVEDFITVEYMRDVAAQAGWNTQALSMAEIAWQPKTRSFVDPQDRPIRRIFKLYPWEWMVREEFGVNILTAPTRWWEPAWKMLLSNKALLAILYEMFPTSPYILPAGFEPQSETYVKKPLLSREGANIQVVHNGKIMIETGGDYSGEGWVYQEFRPLPGFDRNYVVCGAWMVDGYACGLGLREDRTLVTGNMSRFVPHVYQR
jgi:glutathionylspermidine synthase